MMSVEEVGVVSCSVVSGVDAEVSLAVSSFSMAKTGDEKEKIDEKAKNTAKSMEITLDFIFFSSFIKICSR